MSNYLAGIHDREGRHIVPATGWCVDVVALSENPQPTDYIALRGDINWIVRANWGYGSTGTIPLPHEYDKMARACAAYVAGSPGLRYVIIANEPNHENERPNGVFITPAQYADCFAKCRNAIKRFSPQVQVIPAPCAPYHANPIPWLDYWHEMLTIIARNGGCDGLAVHAYTRSSDPRDIISDTSMGPPLDNTYAGFWTYMDALDAVPQALKKLPAYITEFNELLEGGWHDANTGVVQAAYADINDWNDGEGELPIHCLILYRWPKYDKWHIEGKQGVIDDFRAAVSKGYKSPANSGSTTFIPVVSTGPEPAQPPVIFRSRDIDPRAIQRGVSIVEIVPEPGQTIWRVKSIQWLDEQQAQGRHHIYADLLDEAGKRVVGVPLLVTWPTDNTRIVTEAKPGEAYAANYPMSPSRNEFSIAVVDGMPSEMVRGIGMGADTPGGFNAGIHTSTAVTFQRVKIPATTQPAPQPTAPTAFVSAHAGANIRTGPGLDYPIRGAEPYGAAMPIAGRDEAGNWWYVDMPHAAGWVSATVVKAVNVNGVPVVAPPPQPNPAPQPSGDKWQRSLAFTARWEGGYQNVHNDAGNWTGGAVGVGELKGTNFGISAASYPHLDIKNLTRAQANEIYRRDYWQASGADQLAWPACLLVFDTAVLHGVGTARTWLKEVGPNPYLFAAKRLRVYTKMGNWDFWGKAWIQRVADLLEAVGA